MIRRTTKYALNVLRCLAREPGRRTSTEQLAQETGVPANYLSKILSQLSKHDVVEGEKGWRGGFRLRPRALGRSIRSIDEIFDKRRARRTSRECIFGLAPCDATNPCALHARWERVRAERDAMFTTTRVRDLLRGESQKRSEEPR